MDVANLPKVVTHKTGVHLMEVITKDKLMVKAIHNNIKQILNSNLKFKKMMFLISILLNKIVRAREMVK